MSAPAEPNRFVLERAKERATSLCTEIARLRAKDFAYSLPRQLLDVLEKNAKAIAKNLELLPADPVIWNPATPSDERIDAIRTRAADLQWVHNALAIIDRVDSCRLPFEIIRTFERLATQILRSSHDVRLLLQPSRQYNYSILDLGFLFRRKGGSWADDAASLGDAFLLSFPAADPSVLLIHTLFLHELGHPLFRRILRRTLQPDISAGLVQAERALDAQIRKEIRDRMLLAGFPADPPTSSGQRRLWETREIQERTLLLSDALEIAQSWTEEIACDLVGGQLAGSGYLCAFEAFFLPFFASFESSKTHPDSWLRLQILSSYIEKKRSAGSMFAEISNKFGSHAGPLDGIEKPDVDGLPISFRIAYEFLEPTRSPNVFLDRLFEVIGTNVPDPTQNVALSAAIDQALQQLEDLVPPNPFLHFADAKTLKTHELVSFVFYVTWLFKLNRISVWSEKYGWSAERCDVALNEIGLKAIEAGELMSRFSTGLIG